MEIGNKNNKLILLKQYALNFVLMLVFWGGILRTNYNADSLNHMFSEDADAFINLCDGRYIIALFDTLLLKVGIRTTDNIRVSEFVALLLFAGAMMYLQRAFSKWEPKEILLGAAYKLAVSLVFLNVLFSEILMFSEMSVYSGFAYLMIALSVYGFVNKKYIRATICILLAACTYQYSVIIAAVSLIFYIFIDNEMKLTWDTFKKYVGAVLFSFGSGLVNLISIKILSVINVIPAFRKDMGAGDWTGKIHTFAETQKALFSSCYGLFPKLWIPLLALLIPVLLVMAELIRKKRIADGIHLILVLMVCEVLLNVIPFMNETYGFPGRMSFCVFLIIGMMYVVAFSTTNMSKQMNSVMAYLICGLVLVNMMFDHFILEDKYVTNSLDETYTTMFINELNKYEKETGNTVTTIVVGFDDFAPIYYDRVNFGAQQINERTTTIAPILNAHYISGREFEKIVMDSDVREELFHNQNWEEWDADEQIVFIDDTAYWCMF